MKTNMKTNMVIPKKDETELLTIDQHKYLPEELYQELLKKEPEYSFQTEYKKLRMAIRCLLHDGGRHKLDAYRRHCRECIEQQQRDVLFAYEYEGDELQTEFMKKTCPEDFSTFFWALDDEESRLTQEFVIMINYAVLSLLANLEGPILNGHQFSKVKDQYESLALQQLQGR